MITCENMPLGGLVSREFPDYDLALVIQTKPLTDRPGDGGQARQAAKWY